MGRVLAIEELGSAREIVFREIQAPAAVPDSIGVGCCNQCAYVPIER